MRHGFSKIGTVVSILFKLCAIQFDTAHNKQELKMSYKEHANQRTSVSTKDSDQLVDECAREMVSDYIEFRA